jgi:hypothetical protein
MVLILFAVHVQSNEVIVGGHLFDARHLLLILAGEVLFNELSETVKVVLRLLELAPAVDQVEELYPHLWRLQVIISHVVLHDFIADDPLGFITISELIDPSVSSSNLVLEMLARVEDMHFLFYLLILQLSKSLLKLLLFPLLSLFFILGKEPIYFLSLSLLPIRHWTHYR